MPNVDMAGLSSVNQTALLVALRRAEESGRVDALFHDVLAERIAAAVAGSEMSSTFWRANDEMAALSGDAVALRTRFYDDQLEQAVRLGVRQVVMLGVGFDGRAARLNLSPDTVFFEVDQPAVLEVRDALLRDAGITGKYERRRVPADLPADDLQDRLAAAGFRPDEPSTWIAEGLLFYLSGSDTSRILEQVDRLSAPGSLLLLEYPADSAVSTDDGQLAVTADFDEAARTDPWTLLLPYARTVSCRTLTDLAVVHGRDLPAEIDERSSGTRWWYVAARRT